MLYIFRKNDQLYSTIHIVAAWLWWCWSAFVLVSWGYCILSHGGLYPCFFPNREACFFFHKMIEVYTLQNIHCFVSVSSFSIYSFSLHYQWPHSLVRVVVKMQLRCMLKPVWYPCNAVYLSYSWQLWCECPL